MAHDFQRGEYVALEIRLYSSVKPSDQDVLMLSALMRESVERFSGKSCSPRHVHKGYTIAG